LLLLVLSCVAEFHSVLEGVAEDVSEWLQVGVFFKECFYFIWSVSTNEGVLGDVVVRFVLVMSGTGVRGFKGGGFYF